MHLVLMPYYLLLMRCMMMYLMRLSWRKDPLLNLHLNQSLQLPLNPPHHYLDQHQLSFLIAITTENKTTARSTMARSWPRNRSQGRESIPTCTTSCFTTALMLCNNLYRNYIWLQYHWSHAPGLHWFLATVHRLVPIH